MASQERELRDTVERLQAELREARQALAQSRTELSRLSTAAERDRAERARAESALAAADARARDADAAFRHALVRLEDSRRTRRQLPAPTTSGEDAPRAGPWWNGGIRPDRLELWLRLSVGAVVGVGSGLYLASRLRLTSAGATVGVVLASAAVTGTLAWWYGDRYWLP